MQDLVSVVITTYNGSESIENAVISVINQDYKSIEIIVVDDNGLGTEEQINTQCVLKKYIDQKKLMYITHKKNMNGSAARNTGASNSNGNILCFLDDDDIFLPNKISRQIHALNSNNYDMVVCGGYYVDKNGVGYISKPERTDNFLKDYLTEKLLFNSSTIMIKRDVFKGLNGFDESFRRHQDWEFCTRAIIEYQVGVIPDQLIVKYSVGRNVAKNPETAERYLIHFFEKLEDYLNSINPKDYTAIKDYQLLRLSKAYLQDKDFSRFNNVIKKASYKHKYLTVAQSYIIHIKKKLVDGSKKVFLSYDEYISSTK